MAEAEDKVTKPRQRAEPSDGAEAKPRKRAAAKEAVSERAEAPASPPIAATPVPPKAPAVKPAPKAAVKTVVVRQIASAAGREAYQRATLKGLGLDKLRRVRTLEDTPAVRGMIARVKHLVRVESA